MQKQNTSIKLWINYIEEQIELSDSGNNHENLNELYYDFYLYVKRIQIRGEDK